MFNQFSNYMALFTADFAHVFSGIIIIHECKWRSSLITLWDDPLSLYVCLVFFIKRSFFLHEEGQRRAPCSGRMYHLSITKNRTRNAWGNLWKLGSHSFNDSYCKILKTICQKICCFPCALFSSIVLTCEHVCVCVSLCKIATETRREVEINIGWTWGGKNEVRHERHDISV